MALNRLDRANFGGMAVRALLYKAMRESKDEWLTYTISPNEERDYYLISYHIYGTRALWWVVAVCARKMDPMENIKAGTDITVPSLSWISDKLKNGGKTIVD